MGLHPTKLQGTALQPCRPEVLALLRSSSWRRCFLLRMGLLPRGRSRVRQHLSVARRASRMPLPDALLLLRLEWPARVLLHRRLMS
jgi:hypothetical protein